MDLVWWDAKNRELAFHAIVDGTYAYPHQDGWNQLTYAAYRGHVAIVDTLLIDFHWDVETRDINGFSALYAATLGDQRATVGRLLYLGADPLAPSSKESLTPIILAETLCLHQIARRLRDSCAKANTLVGDKL